MDILNKPIVILDTDMDTDCDDVGAMAMLLEAHVSEKIELIGVISDSVSNYAAPFCEAMARYYGVNVPIGAIYENDYKSTAEDITRFEAYRKHSNNLISAGNAYNRILSNEIQKTDRDYPSAKGVYRKLLSEAEDNSVTVLCIGMLTAAAEALASEGDGISPLSGKELFRRKVKRVITMGNHEKVNDFNWGMDAYAAEQFFSLCPVPIYISAEGTKIITGEQLSEKLSIGHPLRCAYEVWLGKEGCGRASWDLIAALYAIEPDCPYLTCRELGSCLYDAGEKRLYTDAAEDPQCKLLNTNCGSEFMAELLNKYMLGDFTTEVI